MMADSVSLDDPRETERLFARMLYYLDGMRQWEQAHTRGEHLLGNESLNAHLLYLAPFTAVNYDSCGKSGSNWLLCSLVLTKVSLQEQIESEILEDSLTDTCNESYYSASNLT